VGADGGVFGAENELYSSCRLVGWRGISHDGLSCGKAIRAEMGDLESPFRYDVVLAPLEPGALQ